MPVAKKRAPLRVGKQFVKSYKKASYVLTVVRLENGSIGYRVDTKVFTSPSTAAKSITGNDVNGWTWWGIESVEK